MSAQPDSEEVELAEGPNLLAHYSLRETKWGLSLFFYGGLVASADPANVASLFALINLEGEYPRVGR